MKTPTRCLEWWKWHRVELTSQHEDYALRVARARLEFNQKRKRKSDRLGSPLSDLEIHRRGALAEVAVSVAEGLPIRLPVYDGRFLLRAGAGADVGQWQVKFSGSRPPALVVPEHQWWKQCSSPYLLVTQLPHQMGRPTLYIVGWIAADDLFRKENIELCYGRFNAYVAPTLLPYVPGGDRCGPDTAPAYDVETNSSAQRPCDAKPARPATEKSG